LDRFISVERTGHGADLVDPPDAADFVRTSITMAPYRHRARVRIAASTDEVAARIPPSVGMLEAIGEGTTILSAGADDLDYFVLELGVLPFPIEIEEPPELRDHFVAVAQRLLAAANAHVVP
ncbi:MAG TPA: WYL domain-containing protein, partial [Ilumatobacteraceae bacterium]